MTLPVSPDLGRRHGLSKFTPERREKILSAIRVGNYRGPAANYAGISEETLSRWMRLGREMTEEGEDTEHSRFYEEVLLAEGASEVEAIGYIRAAFKDDWRAAAHYLERKHAARWGKTDRTELTGAEGGPIQLAQADIVKQAAEIVKRQSGLLNE